MEMHEGLAEYTGIRLSGSSGQHKFVIERNLKDGDAAVNRWKNECEIVVLTPLPPVAPVEDMAVVTG